MPIRFNENPWFVLCYYLFWFTLVRPSFVPRDVAQEQYDKLISEAHESEAQAKLEAQQVCQALSYLVSILISLTNISQNTFHFVS